jgi:hypothetical protein
MVMALDARPTEDALDKVVLAVLKASKSGYGFPDLERKVMTRLASASNKRTVKVMLASAPGKKVITTLASAPGGQVKATFASAPSKFDVRHATWRLIGENKVSLTQDLKAKAGGR